MEFFTYLTFFVFLFFLCNRLLFKLTHSNLPPSPFALPVTGHLHLLKKPLHRTLQSLSHQYGPIFLLRFGFRNVLVLSSPSAIEQSFTASNDRILGNRPRCLAGEHLGYNYTSLAWAPYGPHWRALRRITSTEMFSSNTLVLSSGLRNEENKRLIKELFMRSDADGEGFRKLDLKSTLMEMVFDVMMRMVVGKRCFNPKTSVEERKKAMDFMKEIFVPNMAMGLGDFFPVLMRFGFLGLDTKIVKLRKARDDYLQSLIDEHRRNSTTTDSEKKESRNLMDSLLLLKKADPDFFTDDIIKGIITMVFTAGTDTSAITMEWAMALLLNHPEVMNKAREEIDTKVDHDGVLEDSDLPKLPYLNCIVNETLRLYPAGPLLVPHASSEECRVGGYDIPARTIVLGNAWAIHRDPKVWPEPTKFRPERFEDRFVYEFIPFGVGRRGCPGAGLGMRLVSLVLGGLIQCFEWERVEGEEMVEMSEAPGTTMPKLKPLEALYRPRRTKISLFSRLSQEF